MMMHGLANPNVPLPSEVPSNKQYAV